MVIESMVVGDDGVTALAMVGVGRGRWPRGRSRVKVLDIRMEGILESVPARTIIAGKLLIPFPTASPVISRCGMARSCSCRIGSMASQKQRQSMAVFLRARRRFNGVLV